MVTHSFGNHEAGGEGGRHDPVVKEHLNIEFDDGSVVQFDVTQGVARFRIMHDASGDTEIFEANCEDAVQSAEDYVRTNVPEVELAD